jgi:hypothetical protein
MRREDLRVRLPFGDYLTLRSVTPAEFDALAREWAVENGHRISMGECCMIGFGDGGEKVQGCSPSGSVVGGNGECAEFAVPPGDYMLVPITGEDR